MRGLMTAIFLSMVIAAAALFVGCKPILGGSKVQDLATTSTLKTGFFLPVMPDEIDYGTPTRIDEPQALAARIGFDLPAIPGASYAVATTHASENILVLKRPGLAAAPVASLDRQGERYSWGVIISLAKPDAPEVTKLFLRFRTGTQPERWVSSDGNQSNMYFLRYPNTQDGVTEPVLVNWIDHVTTGSGAVLYRVGNVIVMVGARGDTAAAKFEQIGEQAWRLQGVYGDRDVGDGSYFWTRDRKTYYSLTPRGGVVTKWRRQDRNSMDRVGRVEASDANIPAVIRTAAARSREQGLNLTESQPSKHISYFGIDRTEMDRHVTPLMQVAAQFRRRATARGLGLAGGSQPPKGHAGPYTGFSVFDPDKAYPGNTVVQIENPPGSNEFFVGRIPTAATKTYATRTEDNWFSADTKYDTTHTLLEIGEPNSGGETIFNGNILKVDAEPTGRGVLSQQWTTADEHAQKTEFIVERGKQDVKFREEEYRAAAAEQQHNANRMEEFGKKFEDDYFTAAGNAKWIGGELVDQLPPDPLVRPMIKSGVDISIDYVDAKVQGKPLTTAGTGPVVVGNFFGGVAKAGIENVPGGKAIGDPIEALIGSGVKSGVGQATGQETRWNNEILADSFVDGAKGVAGVAQYVLEPSLGSVSYGAEHLIVAGADAARIGGHAWADSNYNVATVSAANELTNGMTASSPLRNEEAWSMQSDVGRPLFDLENDANSGMAAEDASMISNGDINGTSSAFAQAGPPANSFEAGSQSDGGGPGISEGAQVQGSAPTE